VQVTTQGSARKGAVIGGAIGGGTGAAVGESVGGANGAIVGAGAGGAAGALVGKSVATNDASVAAAGRPSGESRVRYEDRHERHYHDDDDEGCRGREKWKEHPGRGHAYGHYKHRC
ncbi:MAG: hypothetical protein WCA09_06950, partial [Burkholderiales bacterium]